LVSETILLRFTRFRQGVSGGSCPLFEAWDSTGEQDSAPTSLPQAHGQAAGVGATIPTVARVRNRAGGPHARVRLRLQRLSQNIRISSHPEGHEVDAKCPKCDSRNNVEQEVTAFYAVTGKKSQAKSQAGNNQIRKGRYGGRDMGANLPSLDR
jgi:hypothetical protein